MDMQKWVVHIFIVIRTSLHVGVCVGVRAEAMAIVHS
jgi:hypothetical protein